MLRIPAWERKVLNESVGCAVCGSERQRKLRVLHRQLQGERDRGRSAAVPARKLQGAREEPSARVEDVELVVCVTQQLDAEAEPRTLLRYDTVGQVAVRDAQPVAGGKRLAARPTVCGGEVEGEDE